MFICNVKGEVAALESEESTSHWAPHYTSAVCQANKATGLKFPISREIWGICCQNTKERQVQLL